MNKLFIFLIRRSKTFAQELYWASKWREYNRMIIHVLESTIMINISAIIDMVSFRMKWGHFDQEGSYFIFVCWNPISKLRCSYIDMKDHAFEVWREAYFNNGEHKLFLNEK